MAVASLYFLFKIKRYVFVAALLICTVNTNAIASGSKPSDSPYYLEGYDVVSYFRDSGPVTGDTNYSLVRGSDTLLFSSEDNLDAFRENPEAFLPAYNGNCAYGMVYGMKSMIDPLEYNIVDGRLYLQLNGGTKNRWNRRVSRNIKKADRVWRKLTSPSEDRR